MDIERLARECVAEDWDEHVPGWYREMNLRRFAALIAEECAKVADQHEEGPSAGPAIRAKFQIP